MHNAELYSTKVHKALDANYIQSGNDVYSELEKWHSTPNNIEK